MQTTFKGGIHPHVNKDMTHAGPIERMPAPPVLIIPMLQHLGAPCQPLVKPGDKVLMGQKIGDSDAPLSCPVHSSVSGVVKSIEPKWHPSGNKVLSVVIENDYEDNQVKTIRHNEKDASDYTPEEIIAIAREAGISGMGGAGFPTHVKLKTALDKKADKLIINGSECEPFITADHRAMIEYPRAIIGGIKLIMNCLGLKEAFIGIEDNKPDAIATMKTVAWDSNIHIVKLKTKYPQGAEKQLIKVIAEKEVPAGKLPMDVGCAVFNVDTCAALYRAAKTGTPVIKRVVTISGSAVNRPQNLLVRLGTPFSDVFDYCNGFTKKPAKIIMGGPMMGLAQHTLEAPVIKGTNGLLAFTADEMEIYENPSCIRCGKCVQSCPMHLMPNYIGMYAGKGMYDECEKLHVTDCIECGCCAYICPARIHLVQLMRMAKAEVIKKNKR